MRSMPGALVAMLLTIGAAAHAQQQPTPPPSDPIGENFFPPDLVMAHQQEIGLTDAQRSAIVAEVSNDQQRATQVQFTLAREVETMGMLAKQEPLDEEKILAQLDRVLAAERDMKRIHLTLVVRVRNQLTPEQRTRLRQLRSAAVR